MAEFTFLGELSLSDFINTFFYYVVFFIQFVLNLAAIPTSFYEVWEKSLFLEPLHSLFLMRHRRNVDSSCNNLKPSD